MGDCCLFGVLTAVLYLWPILLPLFCKYFWNEVFTRLTSTFLVKGCSSATLNYFFRDFIILVSFYCVSNSFLFSYFNFSYSVNNYPFSLPKFLSFLLWIFIVVLRKFICFSIILLNSETSLLLLTICLEECDFCSWRLAGRSVGMKEVGDIARGERLAESRPV